MTNNGQVCPSFETGRRFSSSIAISMVGGDLLGGVAVLDNVLSLALAVF